jgi:heme o synthase
MQRSRIRPRPPLFSRHEPALIVPDLKESAIKQEVATVVSPVVAVRDSATWRDYLTLTKPEITFLVVISAVAGFLLGSPASVDWFRLVVLIVGVAMTSAGAAMLNHYVEASLDASMKRTAGRPIPSGLIPGIHARNGGYLLGAAGIGLLCPLTNPLTAILAGLAFALYVYVYTPLKLRSTWNTLMGTLPGALPALGGWTAATGNLYPGGWTIFAILAVWQMPHFLSLAWMYRKDYARGGFAMVSVNDDSGRRTSGESLAYTVLLLPISLSPIVFASAGWIYALGVIPLGVYFTIKSYRFFRMRTANSARGVLTASIYYIPALVALLILDRLV